MAVDVSTAVAAVTLAEARAQLRDPPVADDTMINLLMLSATQMAEHELQRPLITRGAQTGYGTTTADVPAAIKGWILAHVDHFYNNASATTDANLQPLPYLGRLLDPFRTWE
jgi:hypothetical protein